MSWLKLQWKWKYHKPPQTMTWTTTNDDMNHHKSPQITINHHKFTMTWITTNHKSLQITTNHDINHHEPWQKPAWSMTRIIMMTKKELCLEPYGFLVTTLIEIWLHQRELDIPDMPMVSLKVGKDPATLPTLEDHMLGEDHGKCERPPTGR